MGKAFWIKIVIRLFVKWLEKREISGTKRTVGGTNNIMVNELLKAQGEKLKQAVINAFKYVGWHEVIDVDKYWEAKDASRKKEEDIWLFDDGIISIGQFVIHKYTESGIYNVTLTVRDDNDASDTYSEIVSVENDVPNINFTEPTQNIQIFEGESYIFNSLAIDDHLAGLRLRYWWNFNSTVFNPLNYSSYELGGWNNAHCFQDDFLGQIFVAGIDPLGAYDYVSADVEVNNVDPSISIWDANVVANLTFE